MDILRISETPMQDESIEYYETHEYETVTGSSLNNPGEIRINIGRKISLLTQVRAI